VDWYLLGGLAAGAVYLASRGKLRRRNQVAAADASGLVPVSDLTHLPSVLQRSALWALAEGGFETRVVHGALSRGKHDYDVTAFDLETLRERRGEWAYLPVEPPFRIAGTVSIVVCEIDRVFPHVRTPTNISAGNRCPWGSTQTWPGRIRMPVGRSAESART